MSEKTLSQLPVSHETFERLEHFAASIRQWTKSINLIAASTREEIWSRHVLDCAQIINFAPDTMSTWCDLGSGAGLPGIVVAILERERQPGRRIVLLEADKRKAAFLALQIKTLALNAVVRLGRIELAAPVVADVVTARALAPLPTLFDFSLRHGTDKGTSIFLKGRGHKAELQRAAERFSFDLEQHQSLSDPEGTVLVIRNLVNKETLR